MIRSSIYKANKQISSENLIDQTSSVESAKKPVDKTSVQTE
jgi:hypothetical protein